MDTPRPSSRCLFIGALVAFAGAAPAANAATSASYLDQRALDWVHRDDASCALSCHTTLPFLSLRPALTPSNDAAIAEIRGLVEARVNNWATTPPWYDSVAEGSRGSEAVLNAVALTMNDLASGQTKLSATARLALQNMWDGQKADGSWPWMDVFGLVPWESADADYWGAVQAALVVGRAPERYLADCEGSAATGPKLARLKTYLMAAFHSHTPPSLYHQALLVQASQLMTGLLSAAEARGVVDAILQLQMSSGAWRMADIGGYSGSGSGEGSAYATAVMIETLATPAAAAAGARGSKAVADAKAWLRQSLAADGSWPTHSLNSPDDDFNNQLATDAATAYAAYVLQTVP